MCGSLLVSIQVRVARLADVQVRLAEQMVLDGTLALVRAWARQGRSSTLYSLLLRSNTRAAHYTGRCTTRRS